jgi:hypothetical protein
VDRALTHEEVSELLGAYALDAVDAEEAAALESHLADCGRCSAELTSYHEVAGMLGNAGGEAPPHIWERLAEEISRAERPGGGEENVVPLLGGRGAGAVRPERTRRRREWRLRYVVGGLVAAALVVIGLLGFQVNHLDQRVNRLEAGSQNLDVVQAAQDAMVDPTALHVTLDSSSGAGSAVGEIAILPSGVAYLINSHMPVLSSGQTYQLWGKEGSKLISLGLLGNDPQDVVLEVTAGAPIGAYAVTAEPAGGEPQPTSAPVAEGTVPT